MKSSAIRKTTTIIIFSISLLLVSVYFIYPLFTPKQLEVKAATVINSTKPLIANFNLTNTNNQIFNFNSFRGKWTLLFFGYSECPSICPAVLGVINDVWDKFNDKNLPAQFIFASLNPKNDDTIRLKEFLLRFNPKFIGVSGSKIEMNKLSEQLNIFANNVFSETGEEIIDHTASLMLIDPKVQLKAIISPPLNANDIASDLVVLTNQG